MFGASIVRQKREKERKERLAREEVATKSILYKQWNQYVQEPPIIPYIKPFGVRFDPSQLPYFKYRAALAQLQVRSVRSALWYSPLCRPARTVYTVCTALFTVWIEEAATKIPLQYNVDFCRRRAGDLLLVRPRSGGLLTVLRCAEQRRARHQAGPHPRPAGCQGEVRLVSIYSVVRRAGRAGRGCCSTSGSASSRSASCSPLSVAGSGATGPRCWPGRGPPCWLPGPPWPPCGSSAAWWRAGPPCSPPRPATPPCRPARPASPSDLLCSVRTR